MSIVIETIWKHIFRSKLSLSDWVIEELVIIIFSVKIKIDFIFNLSLERYIPTLLLNITRCEKCLNGWGLFGYPRNVNSFLTSMWFNLTGLFFKIPKLSRVCFSHLIRQFSWWTPCCQSHNQSLRFLAVERQLLHYIAILLPRDICKFITGLV